MGTKRRLKMLLEFLAHILKAISYNMKQMNKQQI